jgi:hypothetical protein
MALLMSIRFRQVARAWARSLGWGLAVRTIADRVNHNQNALKRRSPAALMSKVGP